MTHAFRFYILWRLSMLNNEFIAAFTFHVVQRSAILLKTPMRWSNTTAIILWQKKEQECFSFSSSFVRSKNKAYFVIQSSSQISLKRATASHIARWNFIQRFLRNIWVLLFQFGARYFSLSFAFYYVWKKVSDLKRITNCFSFP